MFTGLYADTIDWDWKCYTVLYLDINIENIKTKDALFHVFDNNLSIWEKEYEVDRISKSHLS